MSVGVVCRRGFGYQSPYMLLEEAVAASDTLTYGEDKGGALKKAVDEARVLLMSGEARERMAAYHAFFGCDGAIPFG